MSLAILGAGAAIGLVGGLQFFLRTRKLRWAAEADAQMIDAVRNWASRDEMSEASFTVREDTNDVAVVFEVVARNEYRLPARFEPGEVVIDIGTHIGGFSFSALMRGAEAVYCYEPDAGNLTLAGKNLKRFGERAHLVLAAVWRSDRADEVLSLKPHVDSENLGGGSVVGGEGEPVAIVPFDDVVELASDGGKRRIRLVKIDCEGSEYPILLTATSLHLVDEICGEYHVLPEASFSNCTDLAPRCNIEALLAHLEQEGFTVEHHPSGEYPLGHFFARRA